MPRLTKFLFVRKVTKFLLVKSDGRIYDFDTKMEINMAYSWTPMQRLAIDTKDRSLLVSAAAGSGKTAVLTERIISSILDKDNPMSIDEMLIVTFTRAAVGDLKRKISEAITRAINENPNNEQLARQLHLLPGAMICTIDSFCSGVVRDNCDRVGVNPGFRIADTAEAEILAEGILDGLISSVYEGREECATPEALERLAECMTDTRGEGELAAVMLMLYNSTLTSPAGIEEIASLVEEYNPEKYEGFEKSRLGRYAIDRLHEAAHSHKKTLMSLFNELSARKDGKLDKVLDVLENDMEFLGRLVSKESYAELSAILSEHEYPKSPSLRDPTLPPVTALRTEMRNDMRERYAKYFSFTDTDIAVAYRDLYRELSTLTAVLRRFDYLFSLEKGRRGILEYSDIERYAYLCLWQGGELSDVALSLRDSYRAVYIDEYQDVNALQNKIFEAVARPDARFMVGDIKQSIYGFRSADTEIFAGLKKSLPEVSSAEKQTGASVFMSDNFRCDRGIIDFVNDVFDSVFYRLRESIGYVEGDRLTSGKWGGGDEPPYRYPEICLVDRRDFSSELREIEINAEVVAQKIRELTEHETLDDGTPVKPSDIAIIMRNAKGREGIYKKALSAVGIEAACAPDAAFFLDGEVLLALSLLYSVDNPHRDIYLAGLMCSPLFGFTPDELVLIRNAGGGTLWESLTLYTEGNPEYERGRKFIDKLNYYRELSVSLPTDELISFLLEDTGLLSLAEAAGGGDNLMLLYENARRFESGSYLGLYNFLSYIGSVIDRKNSFDKREAPKDDGAVKIITAHSSKGLEYPIVFFVEADRSFNASRGYAPRYVYSEGFGLGMYARTPSGVGLVENPTRAIIDEYKHRAKIEEEARVLYVALTRPRERLYIVATPKKNPEELLDDAAQKREYLDDYSVYSLGSFLEMILMNNRVKPRGVQDFISSWEQKTEREEIKEAETHTDISFDGLSTELASRFSFVYPKEARTRIPEKVSVSRLYPEMLRTDDETLDLTRPREDWRLSPLGLTPEFIKKSSIPDAKARGIATHMLLQFCDLRRLALLGADGELDALVKDRFLSEHDRELVRLGEVELFTRSRLFERMRGAKSLYREFRFNVMLPASLFDNGEEYTNEGMLVQGVIDCLIEDEDGKLYLIDYKTDRLSREELHSRELAEEKLRLAHSRQLGYYAEAVKIMFGKYPERVEVYSMPLGDTVDMRLNLREKKNG